jgi:threonine/homoserine/homoserine lactone efflux protein
VPPERPDALSLMVQLSAVFMLVTLVVFAIYGVLAAAARRQVLDRPAVIQWMRRTFAAVFVALGIRLAVAER